MRVLWAPLAILLVFTGLATLSADTIVLKNGRHVIGENVVEEETRVVYETTQGKFSLAKSLVDHVERDGSVPGATPKPAQRSTALPTINVAPNARPPQVIVDNAVNRAYLDDLSRRTMATPQQRELVVVAFLTAVEFEIEHGHLDAALDIARAASSAPAAEGDPRLQMGLAIVYLQRQDFRQALDVLTKARQQTPESSEVWKLLGFVEYSTDRLVDAIASWKKSLSLAKDPSVERMLERVIRESAAEDRFQELGSNHFTLRFEGGGPNAVPRNFTREILNTLETHYGALAADLGGTADALPPDPVLVILYPGQAFYDVTQAPKWTGALFDGKIRVPVEGLSSMTPELSGVLKHELTHSFVRARSRDRCPGWLNEGLAQVEQGRSLDKIAAQLVIGLQKSPVSLAALGEPFSTMPERAAAGAYAVSLAAVQMLRDKQGMGDIDAILDRLALGASIDEALRSIVGYSLEDLDGQLIEYLKRRNPS